MSDVKKFTAREVEDALENHTWQEDHETYFEWVDGKYTRLPNPVVKTYDCEFSWSEAQHAVGKVYDVLGGVEVVDSDPGGEGHGEDIYTVVRVNETGQFFRIDGYYQSYGDGSQYDGPLYEVEQKEKTVVVYE